MTIDELRKKLDEACKHAVEVLGLRIVAGSYGSQRQGFVCPLGALALFDRSESVVPYDFFVSGFDGSWCDYCDYSKATDEELELVRLGQEFRKKYIGVVQ